MTDRNENAIDPKMQMASAHLLITIMNLIQRTNTMYALEMHHHLIIEVSLALKMLFSSLDEEQDVRERSNCVLVPPHHHVSKSNVIAGRDVARGHARIHALWCQNKSLEFLGKTLNQEGTEQSSNPEDS